MDTKKGERVEVALKKHFDEISDHYDEERRVLIPCFDAFYEAVVWAASVDTDKPRVLDLGAGTGLLSAKLMEKFPQGQFTLVDFSDFMLAGAKERFAGCGNVVFLAADFVQEAFGGDYDLIVSGLAIHHLEDDQKRALFGKCISHLRPGGIFINADQIRGSSPELDQRIMENWKDYTKGRISTKDYDRCMDRISFDRNSSMEEQLNWLCAAGFADVDCIFRAMQFGVFVARKPL
jgi:tRNA (cmo5U34)-methyltransferase